MDHVQRLQLLSSQMGFEPAEDTGCPNIDERKQYPVVTQDAVLPNGRRIRLLKTLLTSACERNCFYCPFRVGRDFRRATFKPAEFSELFSKLYRAGIVEGLFISSGIIQGGVRTQDRLLETAEILRGKHRFNGYLHLKLMPGAEYAQVERGMQLADRVSINLEAPNDERLNTLAPGKSFLSELLQPLKWVEEIRRNLPSVNGWQGKWPSSTTQFVAGGADESDFELLSTTETLYRGLKLSRVYYSAFNPVPDTPLQDKAPTSASREQRLYQASFLLRDYGYSINELFFGPDQNLPINTDPKTAWAEVHLRHNPIEINTASRLELMKIPGIGPKSAARILSLRKSIKFSSLSQLGKLGISVKKTSPYILLQGKSPAVQLSYL